MKLAALCALLLAQVLALSLDAQTTMVLHPKDNVAAAVANAAPGTTFHRMHHLNTSKEADDRITFEVTAC